MASSLPLTCQCNASCASPSRHPARNAGRPCRSCRVDAAEGRNRGVNHHAIDREDGAEETTSQSRTMRPVKRRLGHNGCVPLSSSKEAMSKASVPGNDRRRRPQYRPEPARVNVSGRPRPPPRAVRRHQHPHFARLVGTDSDCGMPSAPSLPTIRPAPGRPETPSV